MTCEEIIAAYFDTMKPRFSCQTLPNGRLSVVMPFLYPDHDNVEIYVRDKNESIAVSDLGETLRRLDAIGMDVQASGTLAYQAERIASGFQVGIRKGILFKEGPRQSIGGLIFDVASACMAIGDLAYRSRGYQPMTFGEEVEKLLMANDLEFEKKHPITGRSTTKYEVDFTVRSHQKVSHVQAMTARTSGGVRKWVNATYRMWNDIPTSDVVVRKVSLLNDEVAKVKDEDVRLLSQPVSHVHRWSERQQFISFLMDGA